MILAESPVAPPLVGGQARPSTGEGLGPLALCVKLKKEKAAQGAGLGEAAVEGAYAGYGKAEEWLDCSELLGRLGKTLEEQTSRYRALVEDRIRQGVEEDLWEQVLPGRDGLSDRKNTVPVILVTARADAEERVEGLNLGADDCIAKPFFMDELLARVQAVLRRTSGVQLSVLRADALSVNLADIVRAGADDARMLAPDRGISVESPPELLVTGDEHWLTQVIENLVTNKEALLPRGS